MSAVWVGRRVGAALGCCRAAVARRGAAPLAGRASAAGKAFASSAGDEKGDLPRPDLRKLSQLAKIKLTEEQIKDFQPKVDKVVDW